MGGRAPPTIGGVQTVLPGGLGSGIPGRGAASCRSTNEARFAGALAAEGATGLGVWSDVGFAPPSGSRLVISGAYGCGKKKGVYRWRVAAGRLTLTKLQATCAYSAAVYAGVWKREKT